jgi:hypothetical protein
MHLLALLMNQLNSSVVTLKLVDFVDISHLLLNICMSDSAQTTALLEDAHQTKGIVCLHVLRKRSLIFLKFPCSLFD